MATRARLFGLLAIGTVTGCLLAEARFEESTSDVLDENPDPSGMARQDAGAGAAPDSGGTTDDADGADGAPDTPETTEPAIDEAIDREASRPDEAPESVDAPSDDPAPDPTTPVEPESPVDLEPSTDEGAPDPSPASCADGAQNGDETGVDCGGSDPACPPCLDGFGCLQASDCVNANCFEGTCISCGSGVIDGDETDVDCGGTCGPCPAGDGCTVDADCQSGACSDGRCCGGLERDCTRCAERLSPSLDCDTTGTPEAAATCRAFLDCLVDNETCTTRYAPGCTEPGDVCDADLFGGNGSPGVVLADSVLGDALCFF